VARADGIPLYAIETVRMLVAEGRLESVDGVYRPVGELGALAVPDTLTALIASRLDGLPTQDRALVADAAVLGQSFSANALAAVSGASAEDLEASLRGLVRREILGLEADPRSPERGQYGFVQALIREVAYNTLAKRDRRSRHLAAARYFESLGNDELVGALAGHYLAAYQTSGPGAEADAAAAQARIALKAAADRATFLGSNAQALSFLSQALEVTTDGLERAEILDRATSAAWLAGRYDDAEHMGRSALDERLAVGDRDGIVRSTLTLTLALNAAGHFEDALTVIDDVSQGSVPVSTADEIALSGQRARALFLGERWQEALAVADVVLDAAEHAGLEEVVADTLITRGSALSYAGRMAEAQALIRAGTELAEAGGHPSAMRGYVNSSGIYLFSDQRAGIEAARAGIALARRRGNVVSEVLLLSNAGQFSLRLGEWDWAVEQLGRRLHDDLARKDRALLTQPLAVIRSFRGDSVSQEIQLIVDEAEASNDLFMRASAAAVKATLAFAEGRHADAAAGWVRETEIKPSQEAESLPLAGRAAAWMRDEVWLAALLDQFAGLRFHGAIVDFDTACMRAAHLALTGRADEAAARYIQCVSTAERLGLRWDQALLGLEAALLLGANHPALGTVLSQSRRIFEELRAQPFLDRLESVGTKQPAATSAGPTRAGTAVSVPS
jgi:tetratricopeptide (TPR) repeat protein